MSEYIVLAQFFVITPICGFLLHNPRVNGGNPQRGLLYAILFLLATAVAITLLTLQSSPPSYYAVLSVPTTSTTADIRRAYKAAAVRAHPDKNPTPTAAAEFTLLSRAYEVLEKPELRQLYDRFGAQAAEYATTHPSSAAFVSQAMMDAGLFYVMWLGLTYILCFGRDATLGRNVAWVLLFLTGVAEYELLYSQHFNPLTWALPYTPVHAKVQFLHALYPSLMHAARLLSQFVFVDHDAIHRQLMQQILLTNAAVLTTLRQLQATVERGQGPAGEGREEVDDGTGTGALPAGVRLRHEESRMQRAQAQLDSTRVKGSGGLPSWLIPIALMIAFSYFGKGSHERSA